MSDVYLVIRDIDGLCVNAIVYNGEDTFNVGEGMSLHKREGIGGIGWSLVNGDLIPPPEPPEETE